MKKTTSILIIFLLTFLSINSFGQDRIRIQTSKKDSINTYGINKFYFVHQLFADAFVMTDLYKQIDYEEMTKILNTTLYKVDSKNKVTTIIKQQKGPDARLTFSVLEDTKDGNVFVLSTNFNKKTRKFTVDLDKDNSIVRWYFIRGEKLVYRKDTFSKKEEREKKKKALHKLVSYYFFDDNYENDREIKNLIDKSLESEKASNIDILYSKLYLEEYSLYSKNIEQAEKELNELSDYFIKFKDKGIPFQYSLIVEMAKTEFEIMKRMNY